jgi:hypothetical protein
VRDHAQVRSTGAITKGIALDALTSLGIELTEQAIEPGPPTPDERVAAPAKLTWQEFEDFVAQLFQTLGYQNVTVTSRARDEGKDLVMEFQSPLGRTERVYVECKQWENVPVGRKEVQVLHSEVVADKVVGGIMVTTGRFTNEAVGYAKKVGSIQLIDGKKLRELIARAGLQMGDELPAKEPGDFAQDKQLEPVAGEQGRDDVNGISPARPPASTEEEAPKMAEEFEPLAAAFDNLAGWARRMIRRLDDVHEKEPMVSAQRTLANVRSKEYRKEYSDTALQSLRSFRQVLDEAQQCLDGLMTTVSQWGPTKRTENSRLGRQQQELDNHISRYEHLFETAFDTYLSLRDQAPDPSLSDCHRDALEGMYYGLSWALCQFVKYPAKEYDARRLYLEMEAPLGLVRRQKKRYLKLTHSAWGRLVSASDGNPPR